ncbi:CpaF family protein [Natribacillus halophilus]|uniref:Pilus assembly protein CpaF n=1 Tax=Natribacillus halophilus TaxID=549003 RepID=A0A1G8QCA9_9BACI|nr:CpaF family protein [Natribacillus halophilus]SDJ02193.1 pilus assembly protein CpaF [Natribacillus halophilus]
MSSLFKNKGNNTSTSTRQLSYSSYDEAYTERLLEHYKDRLLNETNLDHLTSMEASEMRVTIERLVNQYMSEEKVVLSKRGKDSLIDQLVNDSVGFGPLEPLLNDSEITEILINGHEEVYVEKKGQLTLTELKFRDEAHLRHIIDRVVAPLGRRIDESSPMVDARLQDGSRVNAVIPPVSLDGTLISIRKFRKDPFEMEDLIDLGTLNDPINEFLTAIVTAKLNVLISGGTGSGKTTLLNSLSKSIPEQERVVTIEDSAELQLNRSNVVGMEARPPNVEGTGEISIRQLVKNSLRMRPDRIIVGEVRGPEAFDMLQAMNTGHEGSLTTVHANSPFDAFRRVEGMIIMAGMELPAHVIREYIVGAVDIIIQGERLTDGRRRIVSVSEVNVQESGQVEIRDIFRFRREGLDSNGEVLGVFEATGNIPNCLDRLKVHGVEIDERIFQPESVVGTRDASYII